MWKLSIKKHRKRKKFVPPVDKLEKAVLEENLKQLRENAVVDVEDGLNVVHMSSGDRDTGGLSPEQEENLLKLKGDTGFSDLLKQERDRMLRDIMKRRGIDL
jgi:hypothetical protein